MDIADRVLILNHGHIEQIDNPKEIYHSPSNPFVYNFLGHYNVFKAVKDSSGKISILNKEASSMIQKEKWYNKHKIVSNIANIFTSKSDLITNKKIEEYFEAFVRPHDIEISKKPLGTEYIEANVTHLNLAAPLVKLELESPQYELIQAEISHEDFKNLSIKKGDLVYIRARQVTMFTE